MKMVQIIVLSLITGMFLSGCVAPGIDEFGYLHNPRGILYMAFESLKDNQYGDRWDGLFTGKMYCYYTSQQGISRLKKTVGDLNSPTNALEVSSLELIQMGKTIKGYQDVMGSILEGKRYQAVVVQSTSKKKVFTISMSCFKEYSGGEKHHYCMITDLENHILGNPILPVCDDLERLKRF